MQILYSMNFSVSDKRAITMPMPSILLSGTVPTRLSGNQHNLDSLSVIMCIHALNNRFISQYLAVAFSQNTFFILTIFIGHYGFH